MSFLLISSDPKMPPNMRPGGGWGGPPPPNMQGMPPMPPMGFPPNMPPPGFPPPPPQGQFDGPPNNEVTFTFVFTQMVVPRPFKVHLHKMIFMRIECEKKK